MKKTAVITGATGGLGAALAADLARRGYRLVLPCRNADKGFALRAEILLHCPKAELDFLPCNLADLADVAKCGQAIAARHPVIDLVVANAATVEQNYCQSAQGIEKTFAVNHLAHFTLAHWLLPRLYVHSRLIFVASGAARYATPGFIAELDPAQKPYAMFRAYANSKLANIACAEGFAQRLQGQQVACMSFHPGLLATSIWPRQTPLQKALVPLLKALYFASPEKGARALAQLCCDVDYNEGRGYFRGSKHTLPPGRFSPEFGQRLWEISSALCTNYLPPAIASN